MSCYSCTKPAKFTTERVGQYGRSREWCEKHLAEKVAKYELRITPLHVKNKK